MQQNCDYLFRDGLFTREETRMKEGKDQRGWRKNKNGEIERKNKRGQMSKSKVRINSLSFEPRT